jgi:hypothetical protein
MRVIGTPVRSERRLHPEADAAQRGRTRARTRRNRTPTRAPRRRSAVHASKYRRMSMHITYLAEPMARGTRAPTDTYLFGHTHSLTPVCTMLQWVRT